MPDKQRIHFIQDYNVPVKNVFSFFSDHNRLGEIYPAFIRRIKDSPDPRNCNGQGSVRLLITFPLLFQETVTKYTEPSLIEYKITTFSPIKDHMGSMKFIDLGDGRSRLDYTIEFDSLIPKTGFIIKNILEKQVGNAIRELGRLFDKDPNY